MEFIRQISEDEFIVKMNPIDANKNRYIILAHDYLQFTGRNQYCTNFRPEGPWAWANVINVSSTVQIPIRMAQDMLQNVLTNDREYLNSQHLIRDGKPVYCDNENCSYRYTKDDGTKMIAIYNTDTNKYDHISVDLFDRIRKFQK